MNPNTEQATRKFVRTSATRKIIWQATALIFWAYVTTKFLVFDIDTYFVQRELPDSIWIIKYKFFIILGTFALFVLFASAKSAAGLVLYVIFYPGILFFWYVPYFIFRQKSWPLAIAYINVLASTIRSFRYKAVATSLFLISQFVSIVFTNKIAILSASGILLSLVLVSFGRACIFVFQPSSIFRLYSDYIKRSPVFMREYVIDKDSTRELAIESLNEGQLIARRTNIQNIIIVNRVFIFFSKKLKEYQESKFNALSYVVSLFLLVIFTVLCYTGINFDLAKIDQNYFRIEGQPSYFLFLYYSFHVFLFGSIPEIAATGFVSQALSMTEQLCAIFLVFFIVSLYFTIRNEKYKDELSNIIKATSDTGKELEDLVRLKYSLNYDQAIVEIGKLKSNFLNWIMWLSKDVE